MPNAKFFACSALLIVLLLSTYLFLHDYIYPQTADKPFGGMIFFGIFSVVFTVVIAITYMLLKLMLVPASTYA